MRKVLRNLFVQLAQADQAGATVSAIVQTKQKTLERKRRLVRQRVAWGSRSPNKRPGATAAEFVVVLPLFIFLCLMSVDFGRFAHAYIALGNAGRTGAEYGATHSYSLATADAWKQDVKDAARQDFAAIADIDPALLEVDIQVINDAYGLHRTTVTTSYPFQTVVTWPAIPRPLPIERTMAYRRFR